MGTHHPSKEKASSRTNKDGKDYVKIAYWDRKTNISVREKTNWTSQKAKVHQGRAEHVRQDTK